MNIDKKIKLNDDDMDLLKKIFEFSGYTTAFSLGNYKEDRDISNNRRFLYKLVEGRYLHQIQFYSDSDRDIMIYQVTAKTCNLFNNPHSYFRKKHDDTYIIRALIKQHFFFEICKDYCPCIVTENSKRIRLLSDGLGFDKELLPRKYNADSSFIHVEEYILDLRNTNGCFLLCRANKKNIFQDTNSKIFFIYIDKYQSNPVPQLLSLIERYKMLVHLEKIKIGFLIIVDIEAREKQYRKAISTHFHQSLNDNMVYDIPQNIINLHLRILEEKLDVGHDRILTLDSEIKDKYSVPFIITANDLDSIPVNDIRLHGIKAVYKLTGKILDVNISLDAKREGIHQLFSRLYKLYSAGRFLQTNNYDIRIYRINRRFSL